MHEVNRAVGKKSKGSAVIEIVMADRSAETRTTDRRVGHAASPARTGANGFSRVAAGTPRAILALQRAAGNRATARLLQRFPNAADIDSFWSELVRQVEAEHLTMGEVDCRAASNRVARIGESKAKQRGVKANRSPLKGPLYQISSGDLDATPTEARAAHGRGWRVRDRVVSVFGHDYMKVHGGGAGGAAPTVRFYPLLPGMTIYSAEDAGWKDRKNGTYRWYLRHAAIYRSDGWVRENFGAQRRNIMQGHADEDRTMGAWGGDANPKFLATLAIYDPFHAYRSKAEADWLGRGPRIAPIALWDAWNANLRRRFGIDPAGRAPVE